MVVQAERTLALYVKSRPVNCARKAKARAANPRCRQPSACWPCSMREPATISRGSDTTSPVRSGTLSCVDLLCNPGSYSNCHENGGETCVDYGCDNLQWCQGSCPSDAGGVQ